MFLCFGKALKRLFDAKVERWCIKVRYRIKNFINPTIFPCCGQAISIEYGKPYRCIILWDTIRVDHHRGHAHECICWLSVSLCVYRALSEDYRAPQREVRSEGLSESMDTVERQRQEPEETSCAAHRQEETWRDFQPHFRWRKLVGTGLPGGLFSYPVSPSDTLAWPSRIIQASTSSNVSSSLSNEWK